MKEYSLAMEFHKSRPGQIKILGNPKKGCKLYFFRDNLFHSGNPKIGYLIFSSPVGSLSIPVALSGVRRSLYIVCRLCPPQLPEIIEISNPYLVQMFIMFLDCAS